MRGEGFGQTLNRGSAGVYYRFPSAARNDEYILRFRRISFSVDRNASNLQKISDKYSGFIGASLKLPGGWVNDPLIVNLSGSLKSIMESDSDPFPYPVPNAAQTFDSAEIKSEFVWSRDFRGNSSAVSETSASEARGFLFKPLSLQLKASVGYANFSEKEGKWEISLSSAARFRGGRLSVKVASPDFPEKWNGTVSWRLEVNHKSW